MHTEVLHPSHTTAHIPLTTAEHERPYLPTYACTQMHNAHKLKYISAVITDSITIINFITQLLTATQPVVLSGSIN